jgi:transcriptional regulator with XRE-family HTH domain
MSKQSTPYISLGHHLKYVREQAKQSLEEVSGAVEIEQEVLLKIEAGIERPEEDVLMLLISHFKVQDREAVQLWELADYDSGDLPEEIHFSPENSQSSKQTIMLLAMDLRTMYSDGIDVMASPAGVTLNFSQAVTPKHSAPVARVGMSIEQAEQVIKALQNALIKAKYSGKDRLLPPSAS